MTTHELKTWPRFFHEVDTNQKGFEVRKDDRGGFKPWDYLVLREWDPEKKRYTGHACVRVVGYVMHGGQFGLSEGYVVMQIREPSLGQMRDVLGSLLGRAELEIQSDG